jgi:hypothetical protein
MSQYYLEALPEPPLKEFLILFSGNLLFLAVGLHLLKLNTFTSGVHDRTQSLLLLAHVTNSEYK